MAREKRNQNWPTPPATRNLVIVTRRLSQVRCETVHLLMAEQNLILFFCQTLRKKAMRRMSTQSLSWLRLPNLLPKTSRVSWKNIHFLMAEQNLILSILQNSRSKQIRMMSPQSLSWLPAQARIFLMTLERTNLCRWLLRWMMSLARMLFLQQSISCLLNSNSSRNRDTVQQWL